MAYAIRNKRNGKFVYGTDYRYHPPHQKLSAEHMLTYESARMAEYDLVSRGCGNDYEVVELEVKAR